MYRAVIFFVFLYMASAIPDVQQCYGVHHVIKFCCNGMTKLGVTEWNKIRDCLEMVNLGPPLPEVCEAENCIGKKFGYYGDQGLDKQAFARFVETKFEMNKDLVAAVNENCINGDISKHGPPDMCDIMKMQHCFDYQFYKICPEWSNEGECKGYQDKISECFSNY